MHITKLSVPLFIHWQSHGVHSDLFLTSSRHDTCHIDTIHHRRHIALSVSGMELIIYSFRLDILPWKLRNWAKYRYV